MIIAILKACDLTQIHKDHVLISYYQLLAFEKLKIQCELLIKVYLIDSVIFYFNIQYNKKYLKTSGCGSVESITVAF